MATRVAVTSRGSRGAPVPVRASLVAGVLPLLALGVHLAVNATTDFGGPGDELLYLAMGGHLHVWRMDFPPFIELAALLARDFGGGRAAQVVAAVAVLTSPLFLGAGNLLQPVIFDQLYEGNTRASTSRRPALRW